MSVQGFVLSTFLRIIFSKLVFQASDKTNVHALQYNSESVSANFGNSDEFLVNLVNRVNQVSLLIMVNIVKVVIFVI